jgi:phosphotransferase system enzyme I (PtsI)
VADTQLRAILRASGYGPVRMLVPMVSTREEMLACAGACAAGRQAARGGPRGRRHVPLGAMIEVPAAAIAVHGWPIGRLPVDRHQRPGAVPAGRRPQQRGLGELYSPLHPGVLRLLRHIIAAGARTACRWRCAARWPATPP